MKLTLQSQIILVGFALAAFMLAACSQESGAQVAKKLVQEKTVKFNAAHLACLNLDLLDQAESYQKDVRLDGLDALKRTGYCEALPADTEYPVLSIEKEDKDSVVISVMKTPNTLSVVLFTRYRAGS